MTFSSDFKIYEDFVSSDSTVFDENAIRNSIQNILKTRKGSMPGLPDFGSRLHEIPFNITDSTKLLIKRLITESLSRYENRIKITNIEVINNKYNSIIAKIDFYFLDSSLQSTVSVDLIS